MSSPNHSWDAGIHTPNLTGVVTPSNTLLPICVVIQNSADRSKRMHVRRGSQKFGEAGPWPLGMSVAARTGSRMRAFQLLHFQLLYYSRRKVNATDDGQYHSSVCSIRATRLIFGMPRAGSGAVRMDPLRFLADVVQGD